MQRHGYDAACDASLLALTDGAWRSGSTDFRDAHPDACVAQSLLAGASLSLRDTCRPADLSWGYEYVADESYVKVRRVKAREGRALILRGFASGVVAGVLVTYACVAARLLRERRGLRGFGMQKYLRHAQVS